MSNDRPPIAAIEAFVTVARLRHFSAAAGELGVSSSALSQQVRRIEERLVELLAPFALMFPGFCVYYPQRERVPAKLRAFIDFYRKRLGRPR